MEGRPLGQRDPGLVESSDCPCGLSVRSPSVHLSPGNEQGEPSQSSHHSQTLMAAQA